MAALNQAIIANCIKVNILHQPGSALCHLYGCHVESVDHILSSCSTIVQTWLYYCNYHQKTTYMIDIAVPMDSRLTQKENEKHETYTDLTIELEYSSSHH